MARTTAIARCRWTSTSPPRKDSRSRPIRRDQRVRQGRGVVARGRLCADCRVLPHRLDPRRPFEPLRAPRRAAPRRPAAARSSPAGQSARNASHSRCRQGTQLESSIEPPGRCPSRRRRRRHRAHGDAPRRRARPCPRRRRRRATTRARTSACARRTRASRARAPRRRPRSVFGASTTSATSAAQVLVASRRPVDEHGDVVEQRPLRLAAAHRDGTRDTRRRARRAARRPAPRPRRSRARGTRRRRLGIGRAQRDMVEVVVDLGRRSRAFTFSPSADVDSPTLDRRHRRPVVHAQRDVLERAGLARALRDEERQLEAPRVGADQREASVRSITCMPSSALAFSAIGVTVRHPEGDVVECPGRHRASA